MKRFWMTFEGRFANLLAGRAPIGPTLRDTAERLRRLDAIHGRVRRHYLVGDGENAANTAVEQAHGGEDNGRLAWGIYLQAERKIPGSEVAKNSQKRYYSKINENSVR